MSKQQKQIIFLYMSTLLGTLLGVISSIVNTKFIDPVEYGDVRYVQNLMNFVSTILLLGYYQSGSRLLALSPSGDYSKKVRGAMILLLAGTCFVLSVITVICSLFHNGSSVSNLFRISVFVCFYPLLINYINTTAQGDNHIGRLSVARFVPMLIYVPIAYLIYKYHGVDSKIMMLLQWGIYSIICIVVIISTKPDFRGLKPIFKQLNEENKRYGLQLYWGSLVMVATNYIAGITLGLFNEDNLNVGFYTLALTVTGPLVMFPSIIGTTYFKEFAKLDRIPLKVFKTTIFITVLSCVVFMVVINPVVYFLYSERYSKVGMYSSWLAIGFCLQGIGDMINRYLGSHGQGLSIRNSSLYSGAIKIVGFTVLVYFFDINGAIITSVLSSAVYFVSMYYFYSVFVKLNH